MGWFSTSCYDEEMQDVGRMAKCSISVYVSSFVVLNENLRTLTIQHRLCHLIYRMDTTLNWATAIGAKWYLHYLDSNAWLNRSTHKDLYADLQQRLQVLVDDFEQKYGFIEILNFDKLINYSDYTPEDIVAGKTLYTNFHPPYNTPNGKLSHYISDYMWRQEYEG